MELWRIRNHLRDAGRQAKETVRKAGEKAKDIAKWIMENPEKAAAIAGGTVAITKGVGKVVHSVNRNITLRQVEREKRTRVYDHSLNAYIYTKKPLTKEQIEFIHRERRRTGKKVSEIMAEMNILRR